MRYTELSLKGAFVIDPEEIGDNRGFFARAFDAREFAQHGLDTAVAQCNISFNVRRGTVRGLHYQHPPHAEVKLVRCTRGSIFDVAVDLREGSPTRLRWEAVELTAENRRMLYIPKGFAHGYQTLEDATEVSYQVSEFYAPGSEGTVLWNDPAVGVAWPLGDVTVSEKDRSAPPLPIRA